MKIGILSDTHDRLDSLQQVIKIFQEKGVSMICHCGDWVSPFTIEYFDFISEQFHIPIKSIFGNNEGDIKGLLRRNAQLKNPIEFVEKMVMELTIENRNVVLFHGHDKTILHALIQSQLYDAVFTGHTHLPKNEVVGKTLVLNPGTTCMAAESRIINSASVAVYDTSTNTAEIIPFGK